MSSKVHTYLVQNEYIHKQNMYYGILCQRVHQYMTYKYFFIGETMM